MSLNSGTLLFIRLKIHNTYGLFMYISSYAKEDSHLPLKNKPVCCDDMYNANLSIN